MDRPLTGPLVDRPVRVLLADDECLFRASLRHLLAVPPSVIHEVYRVDVGAGFQVVGEAGSGEDTVRAFHSVKPDLLLMDLCMPRMSGLDAIRELCADGEEVLAILLAGAIGRAQLVTAIGLGVRGLILKQAATELLFEAIRSVMAGRWWLDQTLITDMLEMARPLLGESRPAGGRQGHGLTPREHQVLTHVVAGCANKAIARELAVSEETIKHHLTRIFDKVGASNRAQLITLAAERRLLHQPNLPAHAYTMPQRSGSAANVADVPDRRR